MNKEGISHIEVILAFILFVGFIIFALIFFNPLDTKRIVDSSLFYAMDEISNNISVEMVSYSISLEEIQEETISLPLNDDLSKYNVRVEDQNGNKLLASYSGQELNVDTDGERFFIARFSEAFEDSSLSGEDISSEDFTISSSEKREVWDEKRALALKSFYEEDYSNLKKSFNLPNRVDFAFSLKLLDGEEISAQIEIPKDLEVFSQTERGEIITEDGSIIFADLTVRVW